MPDCLESLIGLAAAPVACFPFPLDEAEQTTITSSSTPYFLADVEGLPIRPAQSIQNAMPRDFYDRLAQARRTGAAEVRSALTKGLAGRFTPKTPWAGQLGKQDWHETAATPQNASMLLHTKDLGGLLLRVSTLTVFTTGVVTDLPIQLDGELVGTLASSNQAGQSFALDIPLDGKTHILEAVLPDGVRPRINKLCCYGCGTCTGPNQFLTDTGGNAFGISISVATACLASAYDIPCYASSLDKNEQPLYPELRPILAQAVWYASAVSYSVGLLTDTAGGSRYTALTPDQLKDAIAVYTKKYDDQINWLVTREALGGLNHPCYTCQASIQPAIYKSYG